MKSGGLRDAASRPVKQGELFHHRLPGGVQGRQVPQQAVLPHPRPLTGLRVREEGILAHLAALERPALLSYEGEQLSLFGGEGAG